MSKDLVLLVADKNVEFGIKGLLNRPEALGVRNISHQVYVHVRHDPGCVRDSHTFLRTFFHEYNHAMVIFDRQGSGQESASPEDLSRDVNRRLAANGWADRSEVVVLDPELEVWVFASPPQVERCLGWHGHIRLRQWLQEQGYWMPGEVKPRRPKEALEQALFKLRCPRSSSIYQRLGQEVHTQGCVDPAFRKFRDTLVKWFPADRSR